MDRLFSRQNITIIFTLGFFNFIFLCEEFLFDEMMAFHTNESGVVYAQNIILGASVLGFVAYPLLRKLCKAINKYFISIALAVICAACMVSVYLHIGYVYTLVAGIVEYILLGLAGATACYFASRRITSKMNLAKIIGISYAFGVFIQYLNNNLVKAAIVQTVILVIAVGLLVFLLHFLYIGTDKTAESMAASENTITVTKNIRITAAALIVSVALMTCIFSTLDNAVTLVHTSGSFNIGQWPRLILAISGILAGVLYDLYGRRWMGMMMYGVTILATACIVVMELGGSFVIGLIMFYISAGFFVVFFMTAFMDLSYTTKRPWIWAGMGRAVNNLFAIVTSAMSVALLASGKSIVVLILALVLFAGISLSLVAHTIHSLGIEKKADIEAVKLITQMNAQADLNINSRIEAFALKFGFTNREKEVFEELLKSEDNVQETAVNLSISRATLYRHIGNINEKTNTKNRVTLLKYFYSWNEE